MHTGMRRGVVAALTTVMLLFSHSGVIAATLSYSYKSDDFTFFRFDGTDPPGTSNVSGQLSFDASLLDATGDGVVEFGLLDPSVDWVFFYASHADFSGPNSTTFVFDFTIAFESFTPSSWNIDTFHGHTCATLRLSGTPGSNFADAVDCAGEDQAIGVVSMVTTPWTGGSANPPPSAIPVPAAFPLFATALAGMGLLGWRRRRSA